MLEGIGRAGAAGLEAALDWLNRAGRAVQRFFWREVQEGGLIPSWYGIAYYEETRPVAVCYRIPLNLVIGGWRALVWWVKCPPWRAYEHVQRKLEAETLRHRIANLEQMNRSTAATVHGLLVVVRDLDEKQRLALAEARRIDAATAHALIVTIEELAWLAEVSITGASVDHHRGCAARLRKARERMPWEEPSRLFSEHGETTPAEDVEAGLKAVDVRVGESEAAEQVEPGGYIPASKGPARRATSALITGHPFQGRPVAPMEPYDPTCAVCGLNRERHARETKRRHGILGEQPTDAEAPQDTHAAEHGPQEPDARPPLDPGHRSEY